PSPSQGLASGMIVAAAAGGPVGLAALGGIAAVAAAEYAAASRGPDGRPVDLEAVLEALRRDEAGLPPPVDGGSSAMLPGPDEPEGSGRA
ncbi:MAG TPA: hypothetical protein VK831_01985, partial [Candidatus Deferrimicrobiaceae bacterium]|nr:hypothetical protein [Candidatus Deferrimicrobiaceae bacterium]